MKVEEDGGVRTWKRQAAFFLPFTVLSPRRGLSRVLSSSALYLSSFTLNVAIFSLSHVVMCIAVLGSVFLCLAVSWHDLLRPGVQ